MTTVAAAIFLLSGILGCGGATEVDVGAPDEGPAPAPVTTITLFQDSVMAPRNSEVRLTGMVHSSQPSGGVYVLEVEPRPGLLFSVSPRRVSANQTFEVHLRVPNTAEPGTYKVQLRAELEGGYQQASRVFTAHIPTPSARIEVLNSTDTILPTRPLVTKIALTRSNGFGDTVIIDVLSSLPYGINATISQRTLTAGADTATLTLSSPLGGPEGPGNFDLQFFSPTLGTQLRRVQYFVHHPRTELFTASLSTQEVAVPYGRGASVQVRLTRLDGYLGPAGVGVRGLPNLVASTSSGFPDLRTSVTTVDFVQLANAIPGRYLVIVVVEAFGALPVHLPLWLTLL